MPAKMLQKWKVILTNWINCYFNESDIGEQTVTVDSLLNIISHLRENLSLDESKSSKLEAHTVEEFVREKYPEIRFENGTVEATSDEELNVVASLLLFFVCVNSKDVNIKNAMCSKLSAGDQEVILRFSKCLMECSPITYKDVQTAITEACGQEAACMASSSGRTVSETPPALRSLHGEVRRLQAALDAERFDRNYLQEELARTNLKVEKLLKDKEQSKLEIVNLKAKISMCCGQEAESRAGDAAAEGSAKLTRQLQDAEDRLVETQGRLEDAQYERDTYRAKVEELKQERDKWLATSQQEFARANQLSEELESSRRVVLELRELVGELRAHHQLNRLDSSQLECDDIDASVHSLHNTSICSEACANVIEVQLGEERAKLALLNQQIQELQEQLIDITQESKNEKQTLEKIISERDDDIFNLKHRINEEIEEKNNMAIHYSDEFSKLNNEINELEQKLKDNNNQSRLVIETKMHEIQTLQEEKLSLLQSLNDETAKLENIIKNLKSDLEAEKKRTEEYENHVMKLNEKVLNRNNELVELQNNVFDKSEKIEALHLQLRNEKQAREEFVEKCHNELKMVQDSKKEIESKLQQKCEEIDMLMDRLNFNEDHIQDLNREIDYMKGSIKELQENCKILEDTKTMLLNEIKSREVLLEETRNKLGEEISIRDARIQELHKEMDNLRNVFSEERVSLIKNFEDKNSTLMKTLEDTQEEIIKQRDSYSVVLESKTRDIQTLQQENLSLNNELNDVKHQLDLKVHSLQEKLIENENVTEKLKVTYECQIENLNVMVTKLSNFLKDKTIDLEKLKTEKEQLQEIIDNNIGVIERLEEELKIQKQKQEKLVGEFESEKLVLKNMVTVTESVMEDIKLSLSNEIEELKKENRTLKEENVSLKELIDSEKKSAEVKIVEKEELIKNLMKDLSEIKNDKEEDEKHFEEVKQTLSNEIKELKSQMNSKVLQLEAMATNLKSTENKMAEKEALVNNLKKDVSEIKNENERVKSIFEKEKQKITDEMEELKLQINSKVLQLQTMDNEIKISENKIAEKEALINNLIKDVSEIKNEKNTIEKSFDIEKKSMISEIEDLKLQVNAKVAQIESLESQIRDATENIRKVNNEIAKIEENNNELKIQKDSQEVEFTNKVNKILKELEEKNISNKQLQNTIEERNKLIIELENKVKELNNHVRELVESNSKLEQEKSQYETELEDLRAKLYTETLQANELASKLKEDYLKLTNTVNENKVVIKSLKNELKSQKETKENLITEFESERKMLKKTISVAKAVLEDQKVSLHKVISEHVKANEILKKENEVLRQSIETEIKKAEIKLKEKEESLENLVKEITEVRNEKENMQKLLKMENQDLMNKLEMLRKEVCFKQSEIETLENNNEKLRKDLEKYNHDIVAMEENNNDIKIKMDSLQTELINKVDTITKQLDKQIETNRSLESDVKEKSKLITETEEQLKELQKMIEEQNEFNEKQESVFKNRVNNLTKQLEEQEKINLELKHALEDKAVLISKNEGKIAALHEEMKLLEKTKIDLEQERDILKTKVEDMTSKLDTDTTESIKMISTLKESNINLSKTVEQNKLVIKSLEEELKTLKINIEKQSSENEAEKLLLKNKIEAAQLTVEEQQNNYERVISEHVTQNDELSVVNKNLQNKIKELKEAMNSEIRNAEIQLKETEGKFEEQKIIQEKVITEHLKEIERFKELNKQLQEENEMLKDKITSVSIKIESEIKEKQDMLEEQKISEKVISECKKEIEKFKEQVTEYKKDNQALKEALDTEVKTAELKFKEKEKILDTLIKELAEIRNEKENMRKEFDKQKHSLMNDKDAIIKQMDVKVSEMAALKLQNEELTLLIQKCKEDIALLEESANETKIKSDCNETEYVNKVDKITKELNEQKHINKKIETMLEEKNVINVELEEKMKLLNNQVDVLTKAYNRLEQEKNECMTKLEELQTAQDGDAVKANVMIDELKEENRKLLTTVEEHKLAITSLEQTIKKEKEQYEHTRLNNDCEKLNLNNKCQLLEEYQTKAEKLLDERQKEISELQGEINILKCKININDKDAVEKDEVINSLNKDLVEERAEKEKLQILLDSKAVVQDLRQRIENSADAVQKALRNEEWVRSVAQRETIALATSEKMGSHKYSSPVEKDYRDFHHQVDNTTSDLTHSSMESFKTISDLEKIIHDKNRTITTLQSDITYLKSLIADSENKLLDVSKELEVSKENCQQLSNQLKKIVHQKNEEIAELKKQVAKMSVTENRASQIIKVSAKYQAIILRRIAEIKSNTVLKELTNFGNSTNGDNELRRSLNAGTITMEDLENFLETTDKHLRRCSEKQIALQKERDRLMEVNRINESEIINLKKFLTELSVSFKTFSTVKDLYAQKLSRVLSIQRTVRREVLSLEGHINDATMCKLERGYAAVMQDLTECVMNIERWVERCIGRTISPEKIKQAFTSDEERASFANMTFQNTGLEVQLEELENSFQKLLEEVVRAQKGEGAKPAADVTLMEIRAEYEDKLNRMKAKMKQLYQEQIAAFKEKQKEELALLERELMRTREKMAESSRSYEEHIRALTTELWTVGEKFLTKKDEVEWLRKKQRSGSLMSLQHVHSSGLVAPQEEQPRPSDTHSLRFLPVNNNNTKREGRGLHMSDEEGEVFDNRWLKELAATPRARGRSPPRSPSTGAGTGVRLSELRWRNSLCPPHLKSSYPAETQFAQTFDEEDIKFSLGPGGSMGGRNQRKEVGITAYKKPGPPTPSKQAGRLSATDSELRESLRVEPEPQPSRKTSTPSRLRSLFRSNKTDNEGTPRSRRLSIFRKK